MVTENKKNMKNSTREREIIKKRNIQHQVWPYKLEIQYSDHTVYCCLFNLLHHVVDVSIKQSLADHLLYDLEQNCLLPCTKSLGIIFTKFSKILEQLFLVLVNLLLICMWKAVNVLFTITLWCTILWWWNYGLHFQMHSSQIIANTLDSVCSSSYSHGSLSDIRIVKPLTCIQPVSFTENCDLFRSIDKKHAKKELDKNLHGARFNTTEASGLLGSNDHSLTKSATSNVATKHIPPAVEVEPDSSLIKATGFATNQLPGATESHDQHYETDFGGNVPISREETRKNVRAVFKEDDVDSILQSYQKPQITPTTIGNVLQPLVQDKAKPPAKTLPSSSVNKSHRALPRRACLVHLSEQYRLDHDLLSQPRATKFLVKVRTEISPGRYMAKLELHCSR